MSPPLRPAVFLDRDGVILENRKDYVRSWDDVAFIPGAVEAIASLQGTPYRVVIATNQSGVGRGLVKPELVDDVNRHIAARVEAAGGRIDGVYVCPHRPEDGCDCRKPLPGLLLRAARELGIDLGHSIMIGDALSDAEAGRAVGAQCWLVLTGRGAEQALLGHENGWNHLQVYPDLGAAIARLLGQGHPPGRTLRGAPER